MKKLILVVALTLSSLTFAQNRKGSEMTPEQQAEIQTKRLTLDLDLNSNQQKEVKAIILEQAKKREALKTEMKAKREKGEKLSADERYEKQSDRLDDQIEFKAKMKEEFGTNRDPNKLISLVNYLEKIVQERALKNSAN